MHLSHRSLFLALALAAVGLVTSGIILGEVAKIAACYMCSFQRFMYMLVGAFALCGAALPRGHRVWGALVTLAALGGLATAINQSWMQYAPQQAIECGFGDPTLLEMTVNWLSLQWPSMFMVTGFCTQKDWVFLGLSLANWSVLFFAALALGGILAFRRRTRRSY